MINQESQAYKNWIEFLPGKQKAKGILQRENSDARCCLGHACAANPDLVEVIADQDSDRVCYGWAKEWLYLPEELQKELNIDLKGSFTKEGEGIVKGWLESNLIPKNLCYSLSMVNDETGASTTEICNLIKHLANIEKTTGVSMFKES